MVFALAGVGVLGTLITAAALRRTTSTPAEVAPLAPPEPELITETHTLKRGDTLEVLLKRAGVGREAMVEIIAAVRKAFDVKKFRAGSDVVLARSDLGVLQAIEYIIDPDHMLHVLRALDGFTATVVDIPGEVRPVSICGTLAGSLFESVERTGERAELAIEMAEIFAWDIDFYRDPRQGDEFCMLVEKKEYFNGQPPTYQRVLAATYNNSGTLYDGFLYPDPDGKAVYYSSDGRSLQSAFLRSPLKFSARVSSRFSNRRLHPVLRTYRPHYGTDYAAPVGTPVYSVASGRIEHSSYDSGNGNMVRVRHANGYDTAYLHLSKRLVRVGQTVAQGERIGLTGATGLVSGPHLDFRIRRNGQYTDFQRMKLPRAVKIGDDQMDAFTAERDRLAAMMESGRPLNDMILAEGTVPKPAAPAVPAD